MSDACCRREFMKKTGKTLATGFFGLSALNLLHLREAKGIAPDPTTQKYDAIIQIFYDGGPSQTDTWDPKPGSNNNVFSTINLGSQDIYGNAMHISSVFPTLATLVGSDPMIKLGLVRSMTHNNGDHDTAQQWMNCFWQSPVADFYPSTAASMAHYFQDQGLKIPSVLVRGSNGSQANDTKGGAVPTALQVFDQGSTVQMLRRPASVDAARYQRRRSLLEAFEGTFQPTRPDAEARSWDRAWKQAYDITQTGTAAQAFDLTGKPLLTGGPNANTNHLRNLTLAQELVKSGIPYVALGIGGNDSHTNNMDAINRVWGSNTDVPLAQMAQNLKQSGKRVLIVMGGEFGRTPNTVAPDANGVRRDGRDHWGSGFSWAMLSINQPAFRQTAVGNTGPDGVWRATSSTPLVDPIEPSAFGGMLYRAMGLKIGTDPAFNIPTTIGSRPPVDPNHLNLTTSGGTPWLMQRFGLA